MFLYSRKTTPGSSKHKQWIVKAKGAKANKIFIEESCCWRIYYRNGRETLLGKVIIYIFEITTLCSAKCEYYGNMGCGVFKRGVQN